MVDPGELRRGNVVRIDGKLLEIVEHQHQKIGRGSAQTKLKLRDIVNHTTSDRVFQASQRFERVRLDVDPAQFLYRSSDAFHFMNMETFEEVALGAAEVGSAADYLVDGLELELTTFEGRTIGLELPVAVDMTVAHTDPGVRGDTATAASKPATMSTGLQIDVPLFINTGDVIRVDTRTGDYSTRVGQA